MERFKNILLVILVALALFFSYELYFKQDDVVERRANPESEDVISYARFFSTNPLKENLDKIPNAELSLFLADNLNGKKEFQKLDFDLNLKDNSVYSLPQFKNRGYLVKSGFDVPLKLLNSSTKRNIRNLPFASFDLFYIDNENRKLYINTNKGLFMTETDSEFAFDEFTNYIEFDEKNLPSKTVGINDFAILNNPIEEYGKKDRQVLAERFLETKNIYEIEEENSYTYSSEQASIKIENNGNITYYKSSGNATAKPDIYLSLVAFKNFVKSSLLSFSDYRILSMEQGEDEEYKITFVQAKLPHYILNDELYEARIKRNIVTYFKYNSVSAKNHDKVFRDPFLGEYKADFIKGEDAILIYKGTNVAQVSTLKLR
ncbi:MAG: hypothetical protein MSH08_04470 [Ezakiella sp.]|nr:hypothetical protein [Ezakiella sp.]MDD7472494.1 hypothetical protein [Bacillota bacterium]MDY3923263.1 hypothetical protein [Ezakiella sp.]